MAYENNTGLPSVSDILSPYVDKRWFTDGCKIRGTAVHACCASYLQGLYFPKLKENYQGYMDSFKKWADKNIEDVILVEERLVDKDLGYCGQLDAVLKLKEHEKICVTDLKTGKALQKSWILSIAAYAALEARRQQVGIDAYDCISVRLRCDQKPPLVHVYSDNRGNFDIFRGMLKSYNFFQRKGAK